MLNTNHEPLMISSDLAQAINYGAFEVLGSFEMGELLKKTGSCVVPLPGKSCTGLSTLEVKDLLYLINKQYGLITGQGFYLRIGRVTYQYLRRKNPQMIIDNSIEKRMQLLEDQISIELGNNANWLQKNLDCQIRVKKKKENWIIIISHPVDHSPEMYNASFFFLKGFLQECLEGIDNRHRYVISIFSDSTSRPS